jgi:hypothetical protein
VRVEIARHCLHVGYGGRLYDVDHTGERSLADIAQAVSVYLQEAPGRSLLFYCHGGVHPHEEAVALAQQMVPACLARHVYPVFVCWHTSVPHTIRHLARDWRQGVRWSGQQYPLHTVMRHPVGQVVKAGWEITKRHAQEGCHDEEGAVRQFLTHLVDHLGPDQVPLYLMAHSAGSYYVAALLAYWVSLGGTGEGLALLAPAMTLDSFEAEVLPLLEAGSLRRCRIAAFVDELERADRFGLAPSLLYLVHWLLEGHNPIPLLGMERFLRDRLDAYQERLKHLCKATEVLDVRWVDAQDEAMNAPARLSALASRHAAIDRRLFLPMLDALLQCEELTQSSPLAASHDSTHA